MNSREQYANTYGGLLNLIKRLRGPDGCPWDKEQTADSMKRPFLEECYELLEAIECGNAQMLAEELGDVLFHVAFQIQLHVDAGTLSQDQVFHTLVQKLVRRHPHVFGEVKVTDVREVEANWEIIKRNEKPESNQSILGGVPKQTPALSYAQEIQKRAAHVSFDWEDLQRVLKKVPEKCRELEQVAPGKEMEWQLGDLLFSIVNLARWLGADAEGALRHANKRFYNRVTAMEKLIQDSGLSFRDIPLNEREVMWQRANPLELPDG